MTHNPLHKTEPLLFEDDFFPRNPTTLSLEFVDLAALTTLLVCLFSEDPFLMVLLALEDFPDFETLIPFFIDLTGEAFPDFIPDLLFPELERLPNLPLTFET